MEGSFGYNSELPGGRSPLWIRDDALAGIGLRAGDAVSVDSRTEPASGDLVLAEVVMDDDASERLVRRYFEQGPEVVLRAANPSFPDITVSTEHVFVVGVVKTRVRYEQLPGGTRVVEEPLD